MFALQEEENRTTLEKLTNAFYNLLIFLVKGVLFTNIFLLGIILYLLLVFFTAFFTPSFIASEVENRQKENDISEVPSFCT